MKIRDVMTSDVRTVTLDTPLRDVANTLFERRISGVPVMDGDRCVGIVSEGDLLPKELGRRAPRTLMDWVLGEGDAEEVRRRAARTAGEAMSAPPIEVSPDRPLRVAADLMIQHGINRLPVIEASRLVGIVTRADLVRAYLHLDEEILRQIREEIIQRTMWLEPSDLPIEVNEGHVRIHGTVDRRSTARILEKLIGLVDGVADVDSRLTWRFDDEHIGPPPDEREPGAASITARERPPAMHR